MAIEEEPAPTDQNLYVEDLAWPPQTWGTQTEQISAPEYALPMPGSVQPQPPPPPPPPPPPAKLASNEHGELEEAPAPAVDAAAPAPSSPLATMQPGLGVPATALDAALQASPPELVAAPGIEAPPEPGQLEYSPDAISGAGAIPHGTVADALTAQGIEEQREELPPLEQGQQDYDERLAEELSKDPKKLAKYLSDQEQRRQARLETLQKQTEADNLDAANRNLAEVTARQQKIQQQSDDDMALATKIANEKSDTSIPGGILGKIGAVIASTLGGVASHWTGGHNWGLEELDKSIEEHVSAQNADRQSRLHALGMKQDAYTRALAATGDTFRAKEIVRQATYSAAKQQILTEMQNFDPRGSNVSRLAQLYAGIDAQSQANRAAAQDRQYKLDKEQAETSLANANAAKSLGEYDKLEAKLGGGTGAGGATNPQYTVATGFFSPFDQKTPIMGRRQVGGKGEDPKERNQLQTQIDEYKHVQDQLKKMHDIVEELGGGGKGIEESLWKKRKSTLAADYDAAREALVSYMTKAIGDRPTQGQLELQAQRIPERASVFEARDPVKLIEAQQDEADRALGADLSVIGVDPSVLIDQAKQLRAPAPEPAIADEVAAAQKALASATPGSAGERDAQAALDYANARRAAKIEQRKEDKASVKWETTAARLAIEPDTLDVEGLPSETQAQVESYNQAIETRERELQNLNKLQASRPKPTGKAGVDLQAGGAYDEHVTRQAGVAREAEKATYAAMNATLHSTLSHLDDISDEKREAIYRLADKTGVIKLDEPAWITTDAERRRNMIDAATSEDGKPAFRRGLLKILGADIKDDE